MGKVRSLPGPNRNAQLIYFSAGDATSHLFFAYLRSLSPGSVKGTNGISTLPLSLQTLVSATEYPPERPTLMQTATPKVVMEVSSVSPTPFALLRRAKHFQYRDDDRALQQFSDYEDPIQALTDECRRVLQSISSTNQSTASNSKTSTSLRDTAWSRFEDIGFGGLGEDSDHDDAIDGSALGRKRKQNDLKSTPHSKTHESGRPTTPSWADFLSSGFVDDQGSTGPAPLLLPPDKVLPPIDTSRGQSSQSHRRMANNESELEPGELASISSINLDDAFWWVWISSLAGEEPMQRKAVFGRCALIETMIKGGQWLVVEEMVRGAAPEPQAGAYIAEKKPRFGFSTRNRLNRSKSSGKKALPPPMSEPYPRNDHRSPVSKTSIGPDQHARIQAAAAALQRKQKQQELESASPRRGRVEDAASTKTNSVFTLQPVIMSEAAPAMKWANTYDKSAIRAAYLGNNFTGKGSATDLLSPKATINNNSSMNGSATPGIAQSQPVAPRKESYGFPRQDSDLSRNQAGLSRKDTVKERGLPDIPQENLGTPAPKTPPEQQTPVLSPAPLPAIPNKDMQEANEDAAKAAMVPLPSTTPLEYPHSMERKPLPPPKEDQELTPNQPSRIVSPESGSPQQANGHSASPSPQSKSSKKLKKGPGGLKGFFGKKTSGPPNSPAPYQPPDSTAIAAARAAYAGPRSFSQTTVAGPPMQKSTISRRFSGIGRKRNPNVTPTVIAPPVAPIQDVDETPISDAELTPVASPRYEPPNNQYHQSQASISRIDSLEQSNADREFHNFDQGPLEDQPAFIPHDSPERGSPEFVTPAEPGMAHNVGLEHPDDASQHSEDSTEPAPLVQDRWAQIRKNAAERAARQSEEQSRPSQTDKTDDGETSGEESKSRSCSVSAFN